MAVLGAAAGGGTLWQIPITYSQTWTPPANGTAVIHCIGAGGAGDGNGGSGNAGGGGAGGYSKKSVTLSTSTNWTIAVGAGGTGAGNGTGGNGGNTTATDGSSSLTANGGVGGSGTAAGTGGTASGGDVNRTGGAGALTSGGGGGAVGVYGTGEAAANNYAASADVQSPFMSPSYGFLTGGGRGGKTVASRNQSSNHTGPIAGENGEMFAGGGGVHTRVGYYAEQMAGFGGIGGGGGGAYSDSSNPPTSIGGNGGDGIVIIQYLTVS